MAMGVNIATLTATLVADTRRFDAAMERSSKTTKRSTAAFAAVGRVARRGLFAAGAAAAVAGPKIIGLASDAEETASKFRVVFGKETDAAIRNLDRFSKATGTSRFALREQAAQLQALIRPMGLSTQNAADMSVSMTKLATDLASFNNSSVQEAMTALQSGLVGEAEPLRRFGVQLSANRVAAFAYAKGIAKTGEELTSAQKAQAAYGIILEDTELAQGDAERTAGSFANQFKRLKAQVTDLATEFGIKLLPVVTRVVRALTAGIEYLKANPGVFKAVAIAVGAFAAALAVAATAQLALNLAVLANPYVAAAAALVALAGALVFAYQRSEAFRDIVDSAFSHVKAIVDDVVSFIGGLLKAHRADLANVGGAVRNLGKVIAFVWENWTLPVIKRVLPAIVQIVRGAFDVIGGIVKVLSSLLTGDFASAWDGVKQIFRGALNVILGLLRAWTAPMREAASRVMSVIESAVSRAGSAIAGAFRSVLHRAKDVVVGLAGAFFNAGQALMRALANGVAAAGQAVVDKARSVVQKVRNILPFSEPKDPRSPLRGLGKSGRAMMENLAAGVASTDVLRRTVSSRLAVPALAGGAGGSFTASSPRSAGVVGGATGGAQIVNVYVGPIHSLDPQGAATAVVRALDEWERRNGPRYRRA